MYTKHLLVLCLLWTTMVACSDQIVTPATPWALDDELQDTPSDQPKNPTPLPPENTATRKLETLDGTCALTSEHELLCWGAMAPFSAISTRFKKISAWRGLCGVTIDDRARCYELNDSGQLRSLDFIEQGLKDQPVLDIVRNTTSTCVTILNEAPLCWRDDRIGLAANEGKTLAEVAYRVSNTDDVRTLVAGTHRFCGLNSTGQAYCWGLSVEQLDGIPIDISDKKTAYLFDEGRRWRSIDIYNDFCGVDQEGALRCYYWATKSRILVEAPLEGDRFAQVKLSVRNGCARTEAGRLYCWGEKHHLGQLGLKDPNLAQPNPSLQMQPVHTTQRIIDISGGGQLSNCGLTDKQQVLCWGARLEQDELGQDQQMYTQTPQAIAPEQTWDAITFNSQTACALRDDARVYCWGRDLAQKQLNGNALEHTTPQRVATNTRYEALRIGETMACGRDASKRWSCWGKDEDLALATGDTTPFTSLKLPPQTTLEHIFLSQTSTTQTVTPFGCGLDQQQALVCWGELPFKAEHKDGSAPEHFSRIEDRTRSNPTRLFPQQRWSSIALLGNNVCGLGADGQLRCWGDTFTNRPRMVPPDNGPLFINASQRWSALLALSPDVLCVQAPDDALHCMHSIKSIDFTTKGAIDLLKQVQTPFKPAQVFVHAQELCIKGARDEYACVALSALKGDQQVTLETRPDYIGASFEVMTTYPSTAFGLTQDGKLMGWGHNHWGLLAQGVETFKTTPVLATYVNTLP